MEKIVRENLRLNTISQELNKRNTTAKKGIKNFSNK